MPISCHFRDCEALLVTSLTHVSSAVASTRPLPLPLHVTTARPYKPVDGISPNFGNPNVWTNFGGKCIMALPTKFSEGLHGRRTVTVYHFHDSRTRWSKVSHCIYNRETVTLLNVGHAPAQKKQMHCNVNTDAVDAGLEVIFFVRPRVMHSSIMTHHRWIKCDTCIWCAKWKEAYLPLRNRASAMYFFVA